LTTRSLGTLELIAAAARDGTGPQLLFCENETNVTRLYGADPVTAYPKDGINDHVVGGAGTVNPDRTGTKCAFWYRLTVLPGQTAELRLRLRPAPSGPAGSVGASSAAGAAAALGAGFDQVMATRRAEADEFYAKLTPADASAQEAMVLRQRVPACCGASSCTTTPCPGGWTAIRPSPNRRPSARTGGTPGGVT
jgi:hypothetical protein